MSSDAIQIAVLREMAQSGALFASYNFPDAPVNAVRHIAILHRNTLTVYGLTGEVPIDIYTLRSDPERPGFDLGAALPSGYSYLPGRDLPMKSGGQTGTIRALKTISWGGGTATFGQVIPRDEEGKATIIRFDFNPSSGGAPLNALISGSGLLIYNKTPHPPPPEDKEDEEDEDDIDLHDYQIRFVDLCVNEGEIHVLRSRKNLKELKALASDPTHPKFKKMVQRLKRNAKQYRRLIDLKDFFDYLSYLVSLGKLLSAGMPVAILDKDPAKKDSVEKSLVSLVLKVKELEKKLVIKGESYTVDEFRKKIAERLRGMRKTAPLLGRLKWDQIHKKSAADIGQTVSKLADSLIEHNKEADKRLDLSKERIRTGLGGNTPLPIPVLHIPRLVEPVKKREDQAMYHDGFYRLAIVKLEANQAAMPLVLAAAEIVFGFFCPPVAVLMGIFAAVQSHQEAAFKRALADSEVNIDTALVSQEEADDAEFWATVDAIFAAVDLAGPAIDITKAAVKSAKNVDGMADAIDAANKLVEPEELAPVLKAAGDNKQAADALETLSETADVAANPARVDNALEAASDIKEGRKAAQEARAEGLSLDGANRVDPSTKLDDALENIKPEVRSQFTPDEFEEVVAKYRQYFNKRRSAIEAAPVDQHGKFPQPRNFEQFAVNHKMKKIDVSARQAKKMQANRKATLLEWLSGKMGTKRATPAEMKALLDDIPKFRDRIKRFANRKNLRNFLDGFTQAEKDLIAAARRNVSDAELDNLIDQKIVKPLNDQASRFGGDLEFAQFLHSAKNTSNWSDDGLMALKQLFDATDLVDRQVLDFIVWQPRYSDIGEELIGALVKIRDVQGVFRPVSSQLGESRSIVQRLTSGKINRGAAFEAIAIGRFIDELPPDVLKGTKIVAGKELQSDWLRALQLEHGEKFPKAVQERLQEVQAAFKRGEIEGAETLEDAYRLSGIAPIDQVRHGKQSIKNLIDADIYLEFPDGKRLMVDTKWINARGLRDATRETILSSMHKRIFFQLFKMDRAITEGLVDSAQFWLSHHIVDDLFDVGALEEFAENLGNGKIKIISGVFEDRKTLRESLGASLNPAKKPSPPSPSDLPIAKPPSVVVPKSELQIPTAPMTPPRPTPTADTTRLFSGGVRPDPSDKSKLVKTGMRTVVRLRHVVESNERHQVRLLKRKDDLAGFVEQFGMYRAPAQAVINGKTAADIVRNTSSPSESDKEAFKADLAQDTGGVLQMVAPYEGRVTVEYTEPPNLYVLAWNAQRIDIATQIWRYEPDGTLRGGGTIPVAQGWNVAPFYDQGQITPLEQGAFTTITLFVVGATEGALTLRLVGI